MQKSKLNQVIEIPFRFNFSSDSNTSHCVNWIHIQQGSIIILDQESLLSLRQNDAGDHPKWN